MFTVLTPGFIGIRGLPISEVVELAQASGFAGVDLPIREVARLADERGVAYLQGLFRDSGVSPAQFFLPVRWVWRAEDLVFSSPADRAAFTDRFEEELGELPRLAALARDLGCSRAWTYTVPGSNELAFAANRNRYVDRFGRIADVLAPYGIRLGLEFIGTREIRARFRHEFVHTLPEMLELLAQIGRPNLGLLLDVWHVYTSEGTIDEVAKLKASDVVTAHVNDAPAGIAPMDQIDNVRRLPLETGVLDCASFVRRLAEIGYDGPVTPEPFSAVVNGLAARDPLAAARLAGEAMARLFTAAGIQQATTADRGLRS